MFYERIENLCKINGEKITPLVKKLGMSTGSIKNWQDGALPNGETLLKFSQYFNVSADYLLTGKEAPTTDKNEPTVEEILLKEGIRDDEDMRALLRVVEMMKKKSYNAELGDEFIAKEFGTN